MTGEPLALSEWVGPGMLCSPPEHPGRPRRVTCPGVYRGEGRNLCCTALSPPEGVKITLSCPCVPLPGFHPSYLPNPSMLPDPEFTNLTVKTYMGDCWSRAPISGPARTGAALWPHRGGDHAS